MQCSSALLPHNKNVLGSNLAADLYFCVEFDRPLMVQNFQIRSMVYFKLSTGVNVSVHLCVGPTIPHVSSQLGSAPASLTMRDNQYR